MKLRKRVVALIISILILAVSTTSFAATSKSKSKAKNEVRNKTTKNEVSNSENKTTLEKEFEKFDEDLEEDAEELDDEEKEDSKSTKSTTKKETKSSKSKKTSENDELDSDFVSHEEKNAEYNNMTINGNAAISNAQKVTISNVKVYGNLCIFAKEVEITDSEINGSVCIAASKITISGTELDSAYLAGEIVTINEKTEIARELRVFGSTSVTADCEVGRDAYIYTNNAKLGDNLQVSGKTVVKAENKNVSEDANIDLDFTKVKFNKTVTPNEKITSFLISKGTEVAIILLIAIFILCGFPKFVEVNSSLGLGSFFKAFFTGLLEFIVIVAIAVGLIFTGYGAGYALIILNLLITFILLGKVIFIISFAVRASCSPDKISKGKAFFATVLVAIVVSLIDMISLLGTTGMIIDTIINFILALTGFGSMFRVILTSKKTLAILSDKKLNKKVKKEEPKESNSNVIVDTSNSEKSNVQKELKEEVKAEIKEEVDELKEERKEEKKIEDEALGKKDKKEEKSKEDKKEDNKNDEEKKD